MNFLFNSNGLQTHGLLEQKWTSHKFTEELIPLCFKISTDIGLVEKRRGSGTWENLNMKRILGRKEVSKERLFVTPVKCEDEPTLSLLDFRLKKADKP